MFLLGLYPRSKCAWNVLNRVVSEGDFGREVAAVAERLAAGPHPAYAATKVLPRLWSLKGSKSANRALYDLSMRQIGIRYP